MGIDGCQGTPWSEELEGKELHGAAGGKYDRDPRGCAFPCTRSQHNPSRYRRYGIMLVLKGVVFLYDPWYSCTILEEYRTPRFCLLLAHSFVIRSECSFGEDCPRELVHDPRYLKRVLDLGRVSLKTARLLFTTVV